MLLFYNLRPKPQSVTQLQSREYHEGHYFKRGTLKAFMEGGQMQEISQLESYLILWSSNENRKVAMD